MKISPNGFVNEPGRQVPIVAETEVLVVGGGPAGVGAAVAAARNGAKSLLVERYPYLGGLASGGMVLVIDDMMDGPQQTVLGLGQEYVERLERIGGAVYPPVEDRYRPDPAMWNKWSRWGSYDIYWHGALKPITYAVAFDPDAWIKVSNDLVRESKVNLRLHSWFSEALVEDGNIKGVIVETPQGRQAILASVVIDATGDAAVAWRAGVPVEEGGYIVTLVHRYGNVDTDKAIRFEQEHLKEAYELNREAKRILGGSWEYWWLLTPRPGIIWCNCPHMQGFSAISVEDLTRAEFEARDRIDACYAFARSNIPGFEKAYLLDTAPQIGVRQGRLLQGEYIVTAEDIKEGRWFPDSIARGRNYFTPYRSLIPKAVDQLLVTGRCYSATSSAQKISREIGPCVVMGEAAGTAAALALHAGQLVRNLEVGALQQQLRRQGGDPGETPPAPKAAKTGKNSGVSDGLAMASAGVLDTGQE